MSYIWLSRMLAKHNIRSVGLLPRKISSLPHSVKYDLGLRTSWVYRIPCMCGQVHIRQTGQSIQTRLKEHHMHIWLGHPDNWKWLHIGATITISVNSKTPSLILSTAPGYKEGLTREAVQLELT
jgi:hypothetical protein